MRELSVVRGIRRTVVVLVVLAGLLLALDRVGAWVAGRVAAGQIADELASSGVESDPPEVTIGGVPFLTQVASGEYDEVNVRLGEVGAEEVRLSEVELTATQVTASVSTLIERSGPVHAGRVNGTATVEYESVAALTGLDGLELSAGDGDTVAVRLPVDLLGATVTLVGTGTVEVEGNVIQLRVTDLAVDGSPELPPGSESQLEQFAQAASVDVPLPALPYELVVESARPAASGLAVALSASDVPLSR